MGSDHPALRPSRVDSVSEPNIASALHQRAVEHPDRAAIIEPCRGLGSRLRRLVGASSSEPSRRLTFADLSSEIRRTARILGSRGVGPGDRVLVLVPMSIDLYSVLLGCLHRGATVVFVDAWAGRSRVGAAVAAAAPRAVVGTRKALWLGLLVPSLRRIPLRFRVRSGRGLVGGPAGATASVDSPEADGAHPVAPDDPALVTFTTGSTGRPKGAVRSHAFLWAQHHALRRHMAPEATDVDMPTLPIFVLNNLASGIPSVLPDADPRRPAEIDPARIHRQITREGVTTSTGSPAFYERLGTWCRDRAEPLPLRTLYTGGAPVLPPLARLLVDVVSGRPHVLYGSTEAEPIAGLPLADMLETMDSPDRTHAGLAQVGLCVGPPVPETSVRIVRPHEGPIELDDRGWTPWEVTPGQAGEVVVAGDHVLEGYLGDPEAEALAKIPAPDGSRIWHRTGDAARLDAHGRLWLLGRVGARVLRSGMVVWPLPVELRALSAPEVRHAAVWGEPDPELGQRGVLCVEVAGGRLSDEGRAALIDALESDVSRDGVAVDVLHVVRRIPRDPRHASKTDMVALRKKVEGRSGRTI
ncbi:MAG: hypothetical protein EA351_13950 [Gemmatimonadales bacterium]|nr:MAG: hypothetical protein EA351_13950 [Gemmatimonadales bacterium]